jgi:very-short-patch-repair endonuclease
MSKISTTCSICGREFWFYKYYNRKFCSRRCVYEAQKGKFHPGKGQKISMALTGVPLTEERKRKISIANLKHVLIEDIEKIKEIWQHRYITDAFLVLKRAEVAISTRVYYRLVRENADLLKKYPPFKFLPKSVQEWSYKKMEDFLKDAKKICSRDLTTKYNLGKKTIVRLLDLHNLPWIRASASRHVDGTKPERIMAEILKELKVFFTREVGIGRYFCDFVIAPSTVIEVHGDYWHCNPKFYTKPKYKVQKRNIINDAFKRNFLEQQGYNVIIVWEDDLKNNREETLCKIKEILR